MTRNLKGIEVAEIIPDRCIGCQICVAECPVGAIEMSGGVAVIDPELCIGCGKCFDVCPVESVIFEKRKGKKRVKAVVEKGEDIYADYHGVAVFIETTDGQGARVSWELTGKAVELAAKLGTKVIGFLLGHEVDHIAAEAIACGCEEVHVIDSPVLQTYFSAPFGKGLADLAAKVKPEILLVGATPLGRDLASIVATRIETGLTADCTGLAIDEETKMLLMMTRPTFGGNIMATIVCQHHRPQMSTVRPRVFKLPAKDTGRTGNILHYPFEAPTGTLPEIIQFIKDEKGTAALDIAHFPALVVAGKGACDPESMPMLTELADLVGGIVACSRPVVEAGLMPYERQVGQTGKTVAPKLYLAIGVSGAVQHLVGMQGSEKIVAINSDPAAPIFGVATTGIVGDYKEVVPLLIGELKKRAQKR